MRDILLLLVFSGLAGKVWQQAWLGVLVLAVLTYLSPQSYADGFMKTLPIYQFFFLLTFLRFTLDKEWLSKDWLRNRLSWLLDWRILVIFAFWIQTNLSTMNAEIAYFAQDDWVSFSKALLGLSLTLLLIDTPRKLTLLTVTIGLSIALIALKGGFWSLTHGQLDRVYGPESSEFYDNNAFAIAALMSIPLLFALIDQVTDKPRRWFIVGLIVFCLIAILSTWSRGALLALIISGFVFFILKNKRNIKPYLISLIGLIAIFYIMPDSWFSRMESIANYSSDDSAVNRLEIWGKGIRYGLDNPVFGLGFDGWRHFSKLDWHSSYIESFAEHGFPGVVLWLVMLFGTMLHCFSMLRNTQSAPWVKNYSLYFMTSLLAYSIGSLFLGLTYWSLLYQLIILSVILSRVQNDPL